MRWLLSEYVCKGIYLGLLLYVALQDPTWEATGRVALATAAGLVLALVFATGRKLYEGYRARGRLAAFILFVLLESPVLVYAGILLGMAGGALWIRPPGSDDQLTYAVAGGAGLGIVFWLLRQTANRWLRLGLSLALAVALAGGAVWWFWSQQEGFPKDPELPTMIGIRLLLGLPLFYLLTFAGMTEESEVEIGAICAALALAGWMLTRQVPATYQSLAVLGPVLLYFLYTVRVLPSLRVFKHVVRGISHARIGRYRPALAAFRRALQLDPTNTLARESLWSMHRAMDLSQVMEDPQTLALIDFDMCLERATSLLLQPGPGPDKLAEANRLLDLVLSQCPMVRAAVDYWRAVSYTHARNYDQAAETLARVLDSSTFPPNDPYRESVLFPAWQLALMLHPELIRRVGTPQLALPGRRMEAIAAVERRLAANPEDAGAWDLKRLLYSNLTEAEYKAATPLTPHTSAPGGEGLGVRGASDFDHSYVLQLGLALIADPARWQRGVEFLRLAARGLLPQAPSIFFQIAQAYQRADQAEGVVQYYELAKRAGQAVGPKNLGEEDRQAYFTAIKLLAEDARAREDWPAAIENYHLYAESVHSGLETLRTLADLYECHGDALGALRVTEQGLIYNANDKDLLERKDRYYYSVMPDVLRARLESMRSGFDVDYCLRKAKSLLDLKDADPDLLDWAQHLATLAQVVRPESIVAQVLLARALRRRGEIEKSLALLEEVYHNKPEKFPSGEDEEAWLTDCRLLGEAYLYELGKPDLAVPCFLEYRKSSKSGADTLYKLGQAYEQLGDPVKAAKYYEHVTAYQGHPLAMDARDALERVRSS
jgi:tetratricopeptide (TPR) repeat protein